MAQNTAGKQLSDLLVTRGYEPEILDSSVNAASSAEDAEIFSFDFISSNGTNHGTVVVMLGDDKDLELFSGDNVGFQWVGMELKVLINEILDHIPPCLCCCTKIGWAFSPSHL